MPTNIKGFMRNYDTAIWIRVVGTVLTSLTTFMMRPFLVLYLYNKLETSILLPMIIIGLQPLCGMLVNIFAGNLSDRFGRKPVILISLLVQTISMIGYIFADSVWQFALISIFNGAGMALFMPAANAQITDIVPESRRAEVFALMHTAFNLGSACGPLLGLLLFSWNARVVFLICALSSLAYLVLVWMKIPETLPSIPEKTAVTGKKRPRPSIRFSDHKALYLISLLALPINFLYAQVESTFPLHLQVHFENPKAILAALITFNGLTVIALQLWLAKRTERYPASIVVSLSYVFFAVVAFGYGFSPFIVLLFAVEFLFTIGEMLLGPHIQKVVSNIAPEERRGWYFSVFGMNWQVGRAFGPILGGFMFQQVNGQFMFGVFGLLILAAGAGQMILLRSLSPKPTAVTKAY